DGPDGADATAAAARYATQLAAAAPAGQPLPHFDVLMLGVGEDGHVASIFPGHPSYDETGVTAAVHDSPKPPPIRITLTLPTIRTAEEVWLIAAGPDKTDSVAAALDGAKLPAAAATGTARTVWLLDAEAAAKLS
ncbi:MAG: 6-phosphogluconolactonase, partial [Actinoplanes sp.]|nr:6-phosphogluconolactonase [Actinoplanes sp.]